MNKKPDEYYGSEEHFQDLQDAAGRTSYIENPETLSECAFNFRMSVRELFIALGLPKLVEKLNGILIRIKWRI